MNNLNYLHEDEKRRILNLHKKFINEQTAETVDPNTQALTDVAEKELNRLYPNNSFMTLTADDINKKLAYEIKVGDVNNPQENGKNVMNSNLVPYIKKLIQTKSNNNIKFDNASAVTTPTNSQAVTTPENKITKLQNLLNTKFGSTLVPDGKWGPKTAAAVQQALSKSNTPVSTVDNKTTVTKDNTSTDVTNPLQFQDNRIGTLPNKGLFPSLESQKQIQPLNKQA
jgi:hypothetical protein